MLERQLLLNAVVAGSTYSLVALGFSVIYSVCRFFHFTHAAVITCGAYLAWTFIFLVGLPPAVGIVLAVLCTALLGAILYGCFYHFLMLRQASPLVMLLASLGMYTVIQNAISLAYGDVYRTLSPNASFGSYPILGARITGVQVATLTANVLLYGAIGWALARTKPGRIARAVANDRELANTYGIDERLVFLVVFAVGSLLAGVAGILIAFDGSINPTMGFDALLMGVVAAIIGGVGSIPGSVAGGFFIGFIQAFGVWKLPTEWQGGIVFIVLLAFLVFRPNGFFGKPLPRHTV